MNDIDFARLPNPYDFANPVLRPALFSGRETELREIRYYLDQAALAPRPLNLALLGDRASGKTSLLNMIEHDAAARGFCVARVNLNEADATSQLAFFYKLFDSVFGAVCDFDRAKDPAKPNYPFGGKTGRTYDAYLDMTSAYDVPESRDFTPFVFPLQFAKAMAKGITEIAVSDHVLRQDLARLRAELERPIVILFDECNVLSKATALLQMVRNVFMNTPGFMLVFTGTTDLFPVMDDVFSPIVRQFKKIEVRPFQDYGDTEQCIRKPLESIGINDPKLVFEGRTFMELRRIHEITGGRPYEIQLLCHLMFRQVQFAGASKMRLSLDVLDDVLRELSQGRDVYARPVISAVRSLTARELKALDWLSKSRASLDQLWFVEYALYHDKRWTRNELEEHRERFLGVGLLTPREGGLTLSGDDLDRLYSRYYARKHRTSLGISGVPYELHLAFSVQEALQKSSSRLKLSLSSVLPLTALRGSGDLANQQVEGNLEAVVRGLVGTNAFALCDTYPQLAGEIYSAILRSGVEGDHLNMVMVSARAGNHNGDLLYFVEGDCGGMPEEFSEVWRGVAERAESLGGILTASWVNVRIALTKEQIVREVAGLQSEKVKAAVASALSHRVADFYSKRDLDRSLDAARLAAVLRGSLTGLDASNVAYMFLVASEFEMAREILEPAVLNLREDETNALPFYNLGLAYLMLGQRDKARTHLAHSLSSLSGGDAPVDTLCLLMPETLGTEVRLKEVWDADLRAVVREAARTIGI